MVRLKCMLKTLLPHGLSVSCVKQSPKGINKHALPVTITKSREVRFGIRFFVDGCIVDTLSVHEFRHACLSKSVEVGEHEDQRE
jgi:hypothetical protein